MALDKAKSLKEVVETKLGNNGSTLQIFYDMEDVKEKLSHVKSRFISLGLLANEIKDIVYTRQTTSEEDKQYYSLLTDVLSKAQLKQNSKFPSLQSDENTRILGITEDQLNIDSNKKEGTLKALQQYFIPEIEKSLQQKCKFVYEMFSPQSYMENEALLLSKAFQLPTALESEVKKQNVMKAQIKTKRRENLDSLQKYYKALLLELELAQDILTHEGFKSSNSNLEVRIKWLAAKCDALSLKTSVLRHQLLTETYTTETVDALEKVRNHLLSALEETKLNLTKSREALAVYQSAGPELDALAQQFVQITTEIDNKKWALSQLRHTVERTESIDV